jgi:hypothetical protein
MSAEKKLPLCPKALCKATVRDSLWSGNRGETKNDLQTDALSPEEQLLAISASFPKINRKNRQMMTLTPIGCQ